MLTPKQARFVEEYLVDLNATRAAIRAGSSQHTARSVGAENLTKPDIAQAVAEAQRQQSERTQITADEVLRELALIAFEDVGEFLDYGSFGVRLKPTLRGLHPSPLGTCSGRGCRYLRAGLVARPASRCF